MYTTCQCWYSYIKNSCLRDRMFEEHHWVVGMCERDIDESLSELYFKNSSCLSLVPLLTEVQNPEGAFWILLSIAINDQKRRTGL